MCDVRTIKEAGGDGHKALRHCFREDSAPLLKRELQREVGTASFRGLRTQTSSDPFLLTIVGWAVSA